MLVDSELKSLIYLCLLQSLAPLYPADLAGLSFPRCSSALAPATFLSQWWSILKRGPCLCDLDTVSFPRLLSSFHKNSRSEKVPTCPLPSKVDHKKFLLVLCQPTSPKDQQQLRARRELQARPSSAFWSPATRSERKSGNKLQTRPSIVKISKSRPLIWNCKSLCSDAVDEIPPFILCTKGNTIEFAESVESAPNSWRLKFEMSPSVGVLFQPRRSSNPLTPFCRCVLFELAIVGFRIFCSPSLLCTYLGLWFNHMMHQSHILSNKTKQHEAVLLSFFWWWSLRQFVMTR